MPRNSLNSYCSAAIQATGPQIEAKDPREELDSAAELVDKPRPALHRDALHA
jgi:hypothetical protein